MTTPKIVVVNAGLGQPSSTRLLGERLAHATSEALAGQDREAQLETIDLRPLAHQLVDSLLTGFPAPELAEAIEHVRTADALIAVTPVFTASYSGLFKLFFDSVEPEQLAGKPVLIGATAGTPRHALVLEHAMRPLFTYLHAVVVPTSVFAASSDWGEADSAADGSPLARRIRQAAGELAALVGGGAPTGPGDRPPADEEFTDLVPFGDLLGGRPAPKHR